MPRGRPKKIQPDHLPEDPPERKAHNGPTETEIRAFLVEMTDNDTAMARIRQKGSDLKKRVEKAGGDWKAFKAIFSSTKLSESAAREALDNHVKYHGMINIRVSFDESGQGSFDDIVEEVTEEVEAQTGSKRDLGVARAHGDGYNSARNKGTAEDNPFPPGSAKHVSWDKGLRDYQADASATVAA